VFLPIPAFEKGGILPTGIHDCDLSEIGVRFVYNQERKTIWNSFSSYLTQVIAIPEVDVIYVDGGFVTDKAEPTDIDVVFEFPDVPSILAIWPQYPNLLEHFAVKQAFNVDMYFSTEKGDLPRDFRAFFQYLRPEEVIDRGVPVGTKKGILKISLNDER
jgi:hypothetical protein